jgi:hypothetical protein
VHGQRHAPAALSRRRNSVPILQKAGWTFTKERENAVYLLRRNDCATHVLKPRGSVRISGQSSKSVRCDPPHSHKFGVFKLKVHKPVGENRFEIITPPTLTTAPVTDMSKCRWRHSNRGHQQAKCKCLNSFRRERLAQVLYFEV